MTETEKLILDKLESMSVDLREVKDKTARIEDRVTGIEDKVAVIEDRVTGIEDRVTRMELTIENDISQKIDIIGEGHDFLKQRLDEALQFEKKREGKMKDRLDIA